MQQQQQQQSSPLLQITTWNVLNRAYENKEYYAEEAHPFLAWEEQGRGPLACSYLSQLDSDIYCLQEVDQVMAGQFLSHLNLYSSSDIDEPYGMVWSRRTPDDAKSECGEAVLYRKSRLALQALFTYRYPSGSHIYQAVLFTVVGADEHRFWCVNTHVNWKTRDDDLITLQQQLNDNPLFTGATRPKIVVGDFNAERSDVWYQHLAKHGLVDAMGGHAIPYSYNSGKQSKLIDFVLLHQWDEGRTVRRVVLGNCMYLTAMEHFDHKALPSATVPSDHLPVTVVIGVV